MTKQNIINNSIVQRQMSLGYRMCDWIYFPASATFKQQVSKQQAQRFKDGFCVPNQSNHVDFKSSTNEQVMVLWNKCTSNMIEWHTAGLSGRRQNIMAVLHVSFPYLTKLLFNHCYIQSCSFISNLAAPQLQSLQLNHNNLCDIRSLRKALFPNIKTISIKQNYLLNLNSFSQLDAQSLTTITMENGTDRCQSDCIRWLVKLSTNKLALVRMFSKTRLKQSKSKEVVRQKYDPNLSFQTHFN